MKEEYSIHNLFRKGLGEFQKNDPHLSRLASLPYVHRSALERNIPLLTSGIYILTGGRQVGKTTLVKLIIKRLLSDEALPADNIYYLPCDTIADFKGLLFEIDQFRSDLSPGSRFILFLDEITYVREWDRAIKSLADAGFFRNGSVLITGSDSFILKEAMMWFPGRRGDADLQDFHLFPLSFSEYVSLLDPPLGAPFKEKRDEFRHKMALPRLLLADGVAEKLCGHFDRYLLTGGFLPAVNAFAGTGSIPPAVYRTYVQWIVGDVLKRGKQEIYLREIVSALVARMGKQITWNNLAGEMSIEHHKTVADYIELLARMDVATVVPALREDKFTAAPKKAKKIFFSDPFIFHALRGWLNPDAPPTDPARDLLAGRSGMKDDLIEGTITSLFHRGWTTYYIKAESEVDIALVRGNSFLPIEIKNSLSLDRKGLKQILKYRKGIVAYAGFEAGSFDHLDVVPVSALAMLAA